MTNPSSTAWYHYNHDAFGPEHIYVSLRTGRRLSFRANEIESVKPGPFGSGIVRSVNGYEFTVTSLSPEIIDARN